MFPRYLSALARLGAALARGEEAPQDISALGVNLSQLSPERFAVRR